MLTDYGWFMPYVNINKHSVMTPSQVATLLAYQAQIASTAQTMTTVSVVIAIVGAALGVFGIIKVVQGKKPAADAESRPEEALAEEEVKINT